MEHMCIYVYFSMEQMTWRKVSSVPMLMYAMVF